MQVGHVLGGSSADKLMAAMGAKAWTHRLDLCNTFVQKNSTFLHGHAVWVEAGTPITSFYVFAGGSSATQTVGVGAICDKNYLVLRKSGNDPTWGSTQGWSKIDMTTPWICPVSDFYYFCLTFTAVTMPNLLGNNPGAGTSNRGRIGSTAAMFWWFDSSQVWADFPAVGQVIPVPQVSSNDQMIVGV